MRKVISIYDSNRNKPRLLQNHFHWSRSSQTTWQRMTSSLILGPLTCHMLHPFRHTWEYGCCLHSPYIPEILHLLQKDDQIWLRDHKTCSSEKGIFVLLEIHQYRIQYVFRWDENAFSSRKRFPEILYSKPLYNTNTHLTIRSWDSGQVALRQR